MQRRDLADKRRLRKGAFFKGLTKRTRKLKALSMSKYISLILCKIVVLFLLISYAGCGAPYRFYVPKETAIQSGTVLNPDYKVSRFVDLVNAQPDKEWIGIGHWTHEWLGDMNRWTDISVKLLKAELEKRGILITVNAPTVFELLLCEDETGAVTGTLRTALKKPGCPPDTDRDGVPDSRDLCPGTLRGVPVNEKGCPLDTDRDGVPDYMDKCSDTPQCVRVDKKGCPLDTDGDGKPDYRPDYRGECGEEAKKGEANKPDLTRKSAALKEGDSQALSFTIAGQEPPYAVLQLIRSHFAAGGIILTERTPNVFTFTMTSEMWQDTLGLLKEELNKRDTILVEGSPQIFWMSITNVNLFWGFRDVGCKLNLSVQTLQEEMRYFDVSDVSNDLYKSCDSALAKAVGSMFVDEKTIRDSDGDGVPDYKDECPDTPKGVKVDDRGCPLDTDGDGVPDYKDQCPGTPKGAKVDARGCWVIGDALFDFNKYAIIPRYYPALDDIVVVLKKNPALIIEIQGHTDNIGTSEYNRRLSERRAKAVKDYLVKKGIERKRLFAVGFGAIRPVATNRTDAGRSLNRRVELVPVR